MKALSKVVCVAVIALMLLTPIGRGALFGEGLGNLPENLKSPASLEKIAAPAGDKALFYLFNPPEQARLGVADKNGAILWQKNVGFRPLVEYFWAADGNSFYFQTDCIQKESDLQAGNPTTRSYFFILETLTGKILAQGDLDTDVLNLPKQLPEAMGASHLVKIEIKDGTLFASIEYRGKTASGSRLISELTPEKSAPKK